MGEARRGTYPMSCSRSILPCVSLLFEGDWPERWEEEVGGVGIWCTREVTAGTDVAAG